MNKKDEALRQAIAWADFHGEDVFAGAGWRAVKSMNEWRAKCAEVLAQPEPAAPRTMIEDFIVGLANEAIKTPDASIAELLGALGYVRAAAPTEPAPGWCMLANGCKTICGNCPNFDTAPTHRKPYKQEP